MTVDELIARFPEIPPDLYGEPALAQLAAGCGDLLRVAQKPSNCAVQYDAGDVGRVGRWSFAVFFAHQAPAPSLVELCLVLFLVGVFLARGVAHDSMLTPQRQPTQ